MKPILEAHPDKVRYIRYDTPLVTIHPWALAAAIAGRAVWHQKPDLFWKYKEQIYANQEKLSAFTIDEFARGFASDHDLDMKKYDADVQSHRLLKRRPRHTDVHRERRLRRSRFGREAARGLHQQGA
jgi:protein-disulfide isomerase